MVDNLPLNTDSLLTALLQNISLETVPHPNASSILDALLSSGYVPIATQRLLTKDENELIDKHITVIMQKASSQIHILATLDAVCRADLKTFSSYLTTFTTNVQAGKPGKAGKAGKLVEIDVVKFMKKEENNTNVRITVICDDFNNHLNFMFSCFYPDKVIDSVKIRFPALMQHTRLLHIRPASLTLTKFNQTFPGTSDMKLIGLLNSNDTWAPIVSNKYIGDHVCMMNRVLYWFMMGVPINTDFEKFHRQFIVYLTDRCKLFEFCDFGLQPEESFAYGAILSSEVDKNFVNLISNNCDLRTLMHTLDRIAREKFINGPLKTANFLTECSQQQWKLRLTYIQIISLYCASKTKEETALLRAVLHVNLVEKEDEIIKKMVAQFDSSKEERSIDVDALMQLLKKYTKIKKDHLPIGHWRPTYHNWMLTFESSIEDRFNRVFRNITGRGLGIYE